jgi:hypothetical protein
MNFETLTLIVVRDELLCVAAGLSVTDAADKLKKV